MFSDLSAISGLFISAAICAAAPATAMEAGQCFSMTEMNANLMKEGQRTILVGDHEVLKNPTGRIVDVTIPRNMEAVTSDRQGDGYQLSGNKPKAQISDNVCISCQIDEYSHLR